MSESEVMVKKRRLIIAGIGLMLLVACGDQGAGCESGEGCESVPYPVNGLIIDRAAQMRLTPQGFAFMEQNAGPIIENVMGGDGLSYCIQPISGSGFSVCNNPQVNQCTGGAPGCQLNAELDHLELEPVAPTVTGDPSYLRAMIVLTGIDEVIPITVTGLGTCNHLQVTSYHPATAPDDPTDFFRIEAEIVFNIDPVTSRTAISLQNVTIYVEDLEVHNLASMSDDDYASCGLYVGAWLGLSDFLVDFFTGPIEEMINEYLCVSCEGNTSCPDLSYCGDDPQVCRYDEETCVPLPLGLEGEIDLPTLMAAFNPAMENVLSYLFYMADYATAERHGMSLGAEAGFHAEHDVCVPDRPAPCCEPANEDCVADTVRPDCVVAKSSQLVSDLTPGGSTYMLGVGVSEMALETALWAAYRAGALCIKVGTETIAQLTSSTLAILLRSLPQLTEGANVPVFLHLRPTLAPTVTLGSGEVLAGDPPTIVEPLVTLELRELFMDFYAYVEERDVRLFSLETDIDVPLALTPSDDHTGIQILIGDLTDAVSRVEAHDAELLSAEDVGRLASLLPVLLAGAAPMLADALAEPFEIPELMGYRIVIDQNSFTSIENDTMLAVYANLVAAPAEKAGRDEDAVHFQPRATARLHSLTGPDAEAIARLESRRDRGNEIRVEDFQTEVVIEVDTAGVDEPDREYSYRLDGGMWHLYQPGPFLTIRDAAFLLEGMHLIEVRSRVLSQSDSASLVSEPVAIVIDLASPRVSLQRASASEIEVLASDSVWPSDQLSMRYRFDGGAWSEDGPITSVRLPGIREDRDIVELKVQVTDPAGRGRTTTATFALRGEGGPGGSNEVGPSGCSTLAGNEGAGGGGLALMLAAVMMIGLCLVRGRTRGQKVGRRGRAGLFALLAVLVGAGLVAVGCADEEAVGPGADVVEENCDNCTADQICRDNRCVENACTADGECPAGMVCASDRCVVRTVCSDDTGCPDGQFCIDDDEDGGSECMTVPCEDRTDCTFISCSNGQVPMCFNNSCVCEIPCPEGCGDDAFCCYPTNSCVDLPTACASMDCEVGYGPVVVTAASGDPDSCDTTAPACECQPLPPLPLGDIGAYLSAAAGPSGDIYVSAFNRTYGDLMVGVVGEDDSVDWMFVDGVPTEGTVVGNLEGPRGGIADTGPEAGRYSSIAVGDDGTLHVSYYSYFYRELRYVRGVEGSSGWSWTISTVDDTDYAGLYTDITLSSAGVPGIAYLVSRYEVSPRTWASQVRFAWADAINPTQWTIETVDSATLYDACGGPCPGTRQCNAATNHCERVLANSSCVPACSSSQVCFEGESGNACGTAVEQPTLMSLIGGRGLFIDSARLSDDQVGVAYYDHDRGDLRYSASASNTFASAVPVTLDGEGDVGWYPAITVGAEDAVHITYMDATNWALKYVRPGGRVVPEVVDTGIRGFGPTIQHVLAGYDSSLVVLANGTLQVAYMDATHHDVVLIRRPTSTGWQAPITVLGDEDPYEGSFGFYLNQLLVDDTAVILTYRINNREALRDVAITRVE